MSESGNVFDGSVRGTVLQIGTVSGVLDMGQTERTIRLVDAVTSVFQNRRSEFDSLDGWADEAESGGSRLWEIVGPAGVGKTTFALTWINENAHRFRDAQIAMNCGGGPDEGHGRSIEEMCDLYFVESGLATDGHALGTVSAKITLLRSRLDGKSAVLLLDDVRSAAQVRSFLSNIPGVLVIVTSRVPLPGLAQQQPRRLTLDPLADDAVAGLLAEIVGTERAAAEPDAFADLIRACEGFPLIAEHAAVLLYDEPDRRIGDLVERMAEEGRLSTLTALSALDDGASPSAVFDVSYRDLDDGAARLYRAIGLHPVRDFDAGLFGDDTDALRHLVRRGLVKRDGRGRHLMDDLTYEHATLVALRDCAPDERERIRERIADYYLYGAVAASPHLSQRWPLGPLYGRPAPIPVPDFAAGRDAAAEWVGDNLAAIMACMERAGRVWDGTRPAPGYRWQLAEATNGYFTSHGRNDERATVLGWGEEDARACENADAQARIQAQWGEMLLGQGRLDDAEERFRDSLSAASEPGTDPRGRGAALEWLGITERRRGNARQALEYFDQARPHLDPSRKRSQALHHMHRADAITVLGDRASALDEYAASMRLFRELAADGRRDHANEGKVLSGQGELLAADEPRQARPLFEEALARFRDARRPYQEAKALEALGDLGGGAVRENWESALDRYERHGHADAAERVRGKLAGLG